MYIPKAYNNDDSISAFEFMEKHNFADLITNHNNQLMSNKAPLYIDKEKKALYGHLGNTNPQLEHIQNSKEMLVVFSGPHAYISPQWYVSENTVPTWNFQTLQVRGSAQFVEHEKLIDILAKLSNFHESHYPTQWTMEKLDNRSLESMINMITGFQIQIDDIKFKEKLSQNRGPKDQQGVIEALATQQDQFSTDISKLMSHNVKD